MYAVVSHRLFVLSTTPRELASLIVKIAFQKFKRYNFDGIGLLAGNTTTASRPRAERKRGGGVDCYELNQRVLYASCFHRRRPAHMSPDVLSRGFENEI